MNECVFDKFCSVNELAVDRIIVDVLVSYSFQTFTYLKGASEDRSDLTLGPCVLGLCPNGFKCNPKKNLCIEESNEETSEECSKETTTPPTIIPTNAVYCDVEPCPAGYNCVFPEFGPPACVLQNSLTTMFFEFW